MKKRTAWCVLCGLVWVLAGTAQGGIAQTTGAMTEVAPPASLLLDNYELVQAIFLETEIPNPAAGGYMVTWAVPPPGPAPYGPMFGEPAFVSVVQPTEPLSVYMVHYDSHESTAGVATGSVTFGPMERIIGVITSDWLLDNTDVPLGNPGTTYPTGLQYRGSTETIDDAGPDPFTVSPDRRTLEMTMKTELALDEIRILVIPEPATLALLAGGALGVLLRRRRK